MSSRQCRYNAVGILLPSMLPAAMLLMLYCYPAQSGGQHSHSILHTWQTPALMVLDVVLQEHPELLVRMPYYSSDPKIKRVEDLPVDLQNRILRNYC